MTDRLNPEAARRGNLRKMVSEIVRKYEAGENHDAGAFDPDCDICRILADLRGVLEPKP